MGKPVALANAAATSPGLVAARRALLSFRETEAHKHRVPLLSLHLALAAALQSSASVAAVVFPMQHLLVLGCPQRRLVLTWSVPDTYSFLNHAWFEASLHTVFSCGSGGHAHWQQVLLLLLPHWL
jgi:hypothetical protein